MTKENHKHSNHLHHIYNETGIKKGEAILIEANIDDMNPEYYELVMKRLFAAGALDVYLQPVYMKKNRSGNILSVVGHSKDIDKFNEIIFRETTSIGIRVYPITKYMLPYEKREVKTAYGAVFVKIARYNGEIVNIAPEYEDCSQIAEQHKLPLKKVYDLVKGALKEQI